MRKNEIIILTAMLLLSACHNGGGPKSRTNPYLNKPQPSPYTRSTRATRFADEFTLTCQDGVCPESVGVLFISNYVYSGTCTAFVAGELEGKTVLMTNRHCAQDIGTCTEEAAFRIASTNESAQCTRILKVSEFELGSKKTKNYVVPDYAFLLLDRKLSAKVLPLSQEGLAPQSPVSIRKAWSTGSRSVEMREHTCSTGDAGLLTGNYTSAFSPNISLYDCKIMGGVSGAPILNTKGEVAALIQMGTDGPTPKTFKVPGLDANQFAIDTFGVGTNLACVEFPELGLRAQPTCAANITSVDRLSQFDPGALLSEWSLTAAFINDYIKFLNEDKSHVFGWTVRPDDANRVTNFFDRKGFFTFELAPSCVIRPTDKESALKAKFHTVPRYLGLSGGWSSKGESIHYTPGWTGVLQLDKYGKVSMRYGAGTKAAVYDFSPAQLAALQEGETANVTERVLSAEIVHKLPPCAKDYLANEMKDALEMQQIILRGDQKAFEDYMKSVRERVAAKNPTK